MGHNILYLVSVGIGSVVLVAIAFAFGGGLAVTEGHRHHKNAMVLGRAVTLLLCIYPLLWAWGAPYPRWIVFIATAAYGAVFGLIFWWIGYWYRTEVEHNKDDPPTT